MVRKMAGDHIGMEEDLNMTYKIPVPIVNLYRRIAYFLSIVPILLLYFCLDDMVRLFVPFRMYYSGNPNAEGENPARYETLYVIDRLPRF